MFTTSTTRRRNASHNASKNTPFATAIESLEGRQLMSASFDAGYYGSGGGRLTVAGTSYSDRIIVTANPGGWGGTAVSVEENGRIVFSGVVGKVGYISVNGGDGDDLIEIKGNSAISTSLYGWNGNDTIIGGRGNNMVGGYYGNDSITGNDGNDYIIGGDGNDVINGNNGNDILKGGIGDGSGPWGNDQISGGEGNDDIYGNALGSNTLSGGNGHDNLYGGAYDDYLDGGLGSDLMDGAGGNDTADYFLRFGNLNLSLDAVRNDGEAGEYDNLVNCERVFGGFGNDILTGSAGNDSLIGGFGNDRIFGGAGNDYLEGGSGNDSLNGGAGDDFINAFDGMYDQVISDSGNEPALPGCR